MQWSLLCVLVLVSSCAATEQKADANAKEDVKQVQKRGSSYSVFRGNASPYYTGNAGGYYSSYSGDSSGEVYDGSKSNRVYSTVSTAPVIASYQYQQPSYQQYVAPVTTSGVTTRVLSNVGAYDNLGTGYTSAYRAPLTTAYRDEGSSGEKGLGSLRYSTTYGSRPIVSTVGNRGYQYVNTYPSTVRNSYGYVSPSTTSFRRVYQPRPATSAYGYHQSLAPATSYYTNGNFGTGLGAGYGTSYYTSGTGHHGNRYYSNPGGYYY